MTVLYAYPAVAGPEIEAELLDLLRRELGGAEQTGREMRDPVRGEGADVIVTLAIPDETRTRAVDLLRTHPAVIEAEAGSFGEGA